MATKKDNQHLTIDIALDCDMANELIKKSVKNTPYDILFFDISLPPSKDGQITSGEDLAKIAKAVDIIIIMRKVGATIKIKSISEIVLDKNMNFKEMHPLYKWKSNPEDITKGEYIRTEYRLTDMMRERMNEHGVALSELLDL